MGVQTPLLCAVPHTHMSGKEDPLLTSCVDYLANYPFDEARPLPSPTLALRDAALLLAPLRGGHLCFRQSHSGSPQCGQTAGGIRYRM